MERLKLNIFFPFRLCSFCFKKCSWGGQGGWGWLFKIKWGQFYQNWSRSQHAGYCAAKSLVWCTAEAFICSKRLKKGGQQHEPWATCRACHWKTMTTVMSSNNRMPELEKKKCPHVHWPGDLWGFHSCHNVGCSSNARAAYTTACLMHHLKNVNTSGHSTVRLLMHEKSSWKSTLCSINTNSHITALSLRQQKIDQMENNSTFPQWTLKMWSHTILQRSLHCWQSIHNEISNCILEQLVCNVSLSSKAPAVWLLCWTDDPTVPFTTSVKQLFAFFFCALKDHK